MNPYERFGDLYGQQQMAKYSANTISLENPPHVYAIGNYCFWTHLICYIFYNKFFQFIEILASKALENLKVFKKSQSILITGITGSGETETGKHIVKFLSQATTSQNVHNSSPIFEAFGNAKTRGNLNSSRFCKYVEVTYLCWYLSHKIYYMHFRSKQICALDFNCDLLKK